MLAEIFMEKERKAWLGGKKEGIEEGKKEGIKEGKKEGIKEGIIKGTIKSKYEIAKKLLKNNISTENIKNWTGLSNKEINEIKKEIENDKNLNNNN